MLIKYTGKYVRIYFIIKITCFIFTTDWLAPKNFVL